MKIEFRHLVALTLAVMITALAIAAVGCASDDASLWSPADEAELLRRAPLLDNGEPSGFYVATKCRIIEARRNDGKPLPAARSQCGSYQGGLAAIRHWLR